MAEQHPIAVPPELAQKCWDELRNQTQLLDSATGWDKAIALAYQAGSDQELEACCEYLVRCAQWEPEDVTELRAARRPRPPSLKERALHELAAVYNRDEIDDSAYDAIRLALEVLPND